MIAHILKAVAEIHGLKHQTNLDFRDIKDWLIGKTREQQIQIWFLHSYQLHQNFYRILMTQEEIDERFESVMALAEIARPFAKP